MEQETTNRELMHFIKDIKEDVGEIKFQTIKTNGRVSTLEKWMYVSMGAISIIGWLVGANLLSLTRLL